MRSLLDAKAQIDAPCYGEQRERVMSFLASVSHKFPRTPLMCAAEWGAASSVEVLLKRGATSPLIPLRSIKSELQSEIGRHGPEAEEWHSMARIQRLVLILGLFK